MWRAAGDDSDFKASSEFFKAKFLSMSKNKIYPHVTCATDTTATFLYTAALDIIVRSSCEPRRTA